MLWGKLTFAIVCGDQHDTVFEKRAERARQLLIEFLKN